jgi:hypothetical protein
MLKISNASLLASLAACCSMLAAVAVAQDASSSTATSSQTNPAAQSDALQTKAQSASATNPSNLPQAASSTTAQQTKAPVVDPETAAQDAANAKAGAPINPAPLPANTNNGAPTGRAAAAPPQPYQANRPTGTETANGPGGGSLGVNVVSTDDGQGVTVTQTRPGTPADQMGLQPNDRITSLNGQPVESVGQFISDIRSMNPGEQIQLSIDRGGNTQNIGGRLEALRDRLASREGPVGNAIGRARDFVRDRGDMTNDSQGGRQTNYEESISARPTSNLEARLSRLEQRMDQLIRDVEQLRSSPGSSQPSTATQPGAAGMGTTGSGSSTTGLRDSSASFPTSTPGATPTTPGLTPPPNGTSGTSGTNGTGTSGASGSSGTSPTR